MTSIGNANAKAIWEANVPPNYPRPKESDSQSVIKKWIVAKYEDKEFKATSPASVRPTKVPSREINSTPANVHDMD